jgi:NAD(P)H-dependent FMN reductase
MSILILNGSPRKKGVVASLLGAVAQGLEESGRRVEWVHAYDLSVAPCIGCMKCRPGGGCVLPTDDGHRLAEMLGSCEGLVVGTPTYWGNMSAALKLIFERSVPELMGEKPGGMPIPKHKGKPAAMVTACTTPWPLNFLAAESRGAFRAVGEVLHYSGFKVKGKVAQPGTKQRPGATEKKLARARALGARM